MATAGRAKSLGDVTEGGLLGMEAQINYLRELNGASKEIFDGVEETERLIEELKKKMSNQDKPQNQSSQDSLICPAPGCRRLQDSTHIDSVNGRGTYQRLKKEQK